MRNVVLTALLLFVMPVRAADVEAGGQYVLAMTTGDTGTLDVKTSGGFGAQLEVFWSERVSTRASATFHNPAAILFPENPPPADVDLGTLGLDIYALSARFHTDPVGRFSFYAGAGGAIVDIGNLDDQFGDAVLIEFDPQAAALVETGIRFRALPRVHLEANAMWLPLEAEGEVLVATDPRIPLEPVLELDPLRVSLGVAWRF